MSSYQGFWSYVHADDQAEGMRISLLAKHLVDQIEMLSGEKIELFLDKDAIGWGEKWRERIDESLATVAFFLPVLTPRYFLRPECRRELQFFARKAIDLGIKDLILPLVYVDVSGLHEETPSDDLIALIKEFQWENWSDLRFSEVTSESYRRGIDRLARRLVVANKVAEEIDKNKTLQAIREETPEDIDELPGFIDQMVAAEEAMPKWVETLNELKENVDLVGTIMREGTDDIKDRSSKTQGFAARLIVARRVASQLVEPTENIWELSNQYASQLHDVDEGYRAIFERIPIELQNDPSSKDTTCEFIRVTRTLISSAQVALDNTQSMINAIGPLEKMSRDLRPVSRRLRQGLTILVESRQIMDEWQKLIDALNLSCEEHNS